MNSQRSDQNRSQVNICYSLEMDDVALDPSSLKTFAVLGSPIAQPYMSFSPEAAPQSKRASLF